MHLWQDELIDDATLEERLPTLGARVEEALRTPLDMAMVILAAERLADRMSSEAPLRQRLLATLQARSLSAQEAQATLDEVADFLRRDHLESKLERELGTVEPFTIRRIDYSREVFEAWMPLGLLVHLAPTNAPAVGTLSVLEGLLSGNVNFAKTSSRDSRFAQEFYQALGECDPSRRLREFIYVAQFSSQRSDLLGQICAQADGVAAWGGEDAIRAARTLTPPHARLIEWGHRLSFAYISRSQLDNPEWLEPLARECCLYEQQACSSPQCLYLDTDDHQELRAFAAALAPVMDRVSHSMERTLPGPAEWAEITTVTELARLDECLERSRVWQASDRSWRLIVDDGSGLMASPLFRTLWIKPLPSQRIVATLRPLRQYLQTAGLAASRPELDVLCNRLYAAGVQRITSIGQMLSSYVGEPHDGVYALQRYTRRVSAQLGQTLERISSFGELRPPQQQSAQIISVMSKEQFQARAVDDQYAHLYFRSGGSTGQPKLSVFTYHDYHYQMLGAAEGLYAAGLDPRQDRCMNLFFGGGLYGGFISFFSVLEILRAVQFPMAAVEDHQAVARAIIDYRVNVLLGMPSYLLTLFEEHGQALKDYGGVRKIFYGGEHFNEKQKELFQREFGVELVRSAAYGTVDAGPVGYQCRHCQGSVHHLQARLQSLEILQVDRDQPVQGEEVGRLVFTSHQRRGQHIERYDLGDVGRWVKQACPCGRQDPLFVLLGRHGDVFRAGTNFLNYRRFVQIAADFCDYGGELQLLLDEGSQGERLTVYTSLQLSSAEALREQLLARYGDLAESVGLGMEFRVLAVPSDSLERIAGSGKLREVMDRRSSAQPQTTGR